MAMPDEDEHRHTSHSPANDRLADVEDLCGEVETYIRVRPFRSMLIALFVGILVGKIIL